MSKLAVPITVGSRAALSQVHVAELPGGTLAFVEDTNAYYSLHKASALPVDGSIVIAPITGSPAAGGLSTQWVILAGGAGSPGQTYESHLEDDAMITTAAPTAPFDFGPGQPAMLVSLTATLREGPALLRYTFGVFLQNDDPANENQPFVQFQLWVDGVEVPFVRSTVSPFTGLPAPVTGLEGAGGGESLLDVTAGSHLFELRWGVSGGVPAATATSFAASGFDHASMVVQEV